MTRKAATAATPKKRARTPSAKAKPPAKRGARAAKAVVPAKIDAPADWPANLDDKTAEALFDHVESGLTIKQAAEKLGLKGNTVYQWKIRFPRFGQRLDDAIDIGIEMMADAEIELADKAKCRDTAAAVREQREARASYRKIKRPGRFHVNPFRANPSGHGFMVGVVMVPAKELIAAAATPDPARDPRVIEGQGTVLIPSKEPGA